MKKVGIIAVLFICIHSNAQVRHFWDTIRYDLKQPRKFFLGMDGKNSIISDFTIKMFGFQGGTIYNSRTKFYSGLYFTPRKRSTIIENSTALPGRTDSNTVYVSYGLTYMNFGTAYIFYNTKYWEISAYLALGLGAGTYKKHTDTRYYSASHPVIVPLETGFNASFKLTWWLWLSAGLGTRMAIIGKHDYNGALYTYGVSVKLDAIYKKFRPAAEKAYQKSKYNKS